MTQSERNAANRGARWASLALVALCLLILAGFAAYSAFSQQPEPTPTPTMLAELGTPAEPSILDRLTTPIVNLLGRHPFVFLVIGIAVLVTNGLRVAWPIRAERPRLVAFLIGVLDPVTGNVWALIRWLAARIGFPVQTPGGDPPTGSGVLPDPNALPVEKK